MKCPYCIKACSKCGEILVANNMNFAKAKRGKYGLQSICKKCKSQRSKEYRKNNAEQIKEQRKEFYKNNAEKIKEHKKEYYKNNTEQIKDQAKEYRKNNPDKMFNKNNKRRQRLENQGMGINKEQWLDMMKYFDFKCAYSGKPLKDNNRTIDHVKPLVKGGLNEIFNCVPCDRSVNSSKHDKDFLQWYKEQEFYDESRLQKIYEWQQHCLETYYEYIKIS